MAHDVASLVREGVIDSQHANPKHNLMLRTKHERKVSMLNADDRRTYDLLLAEMRAHNQHRAPQR